MVLISLIYHIVLMSHNYSLNKGMRMLQEEENSQTNCFNNRLSIVCWCVMVDCYSSLNILAILCILYHVCHSSYISESRWSFLLRIHLRLELDLSAKMKVIKKYRATAKPTQIFLNIKYGICASSVADVLKTARCATWTI